ncbi:MAG: HAD-IC family P-type ATPase [Cyanomargarita calcarea GSE-NOS-MK-12-04C]|jgi:cation-transporting ATPase E|uniref:HAD-IC family P-type ATPase n=1 Tax=Cyanomargarita calcarea GSE-NOS-MK-12-04C TaxID=2839659 RepID=A0A951UUB5_9CYAN|nr:HAD-IC family P-type ATPase [Cyanomargarita calcarea GSE-NOS-MK-12-04C]
MEYHSFTEQGLTEEEVKKRRAEGLGNNVSLQTSRSYRQILTENLFNFINIVFFTISVVMILLRRYSDAFLVVIVIGSGVVIAVCQEIWAKRKLDEIALINRPKATAIRDSKEYDIDPGDIVQGDILVIASGDQILVDGVVVGDGRIDVDESLLTGESDLIAKVAEDTVYSGTFCVTGRAYFEAKKVGVETVAYKLIAGARVFRYCHTPLQAEINLVIRILLLLACFLWILVGISFLSRSYSLADVVQHAAVVAGLVPSGLLIAITLAYGTAAVRMLGQDVLIQQANAVESLSHVDVLCLDKTGTLTANKINLLSVYPIGVSEVTLRQKLGDYVTNTTDHNRTTEAIAAVCSGKKSSVKAEVIFSSARKWSAIVFDDSPKDVYILGAPEILADSVFLASEAKTYIQESFEQGLRVLLFAWSENLDSLGNDPQKPTLPSNLTPLGIILFSDELRPKVTETLDAFMAAGIKLKIISGDNPETVASIARQAGFGGEINLISGLELGMMDEAQFANQASSCTIFGRITPEQKAKLVQTLRHQGNYVAMIGDGVNDVLSLKQASLAIAMESGSKATRSVADIVLLKDSFAALPYALLEGQRIRNGIRDSLALFIVRVFCVTLLIFSIGMVTDSFPLVNKHSALLAMFGVGLPTAIFPLWAKPGEVQKQRSIIRSLLHFTIPATLTMTLVALLVYLLYLVRAIWDIPPGQEFNQLDYTLPRTALVTILVLCHLFLLPFLKPPTTAWVGGERLSGDWRYTIAALILFAIFMTILNVPQSRIFFELAALSQLDCLFLVLVALEWCLILRAVWRTRFFNRFLGIDLS